MAPARCVNTIGKIGAGLGMPRRRRNFATSGCEQGASKNIVPAHDSTGPPKKVSRMRRLRLAGIAAVVLVAAAATGFWQLSKSRTFQLFGTIVPRVETTEKVVALTFDDGPTAQYTDAVLAQLVERGVTATFFLTGRETEENPDKARAIAAAGHELGNHSFSHSNMALMGGAAVRDEIERTDRALRAAGQDGPIHFRPPYGKKFFALPRYLEATGRTTVTWDIEPETFDDVAADPKKIADHVLERARPGSIVLLHVMYGSRETSRQALPLIIDGLRGRGFSFVTVSELMAKG